MPVRARVYIGLVLAAGAGVLGHGLLHWQSHNWLQYVVYCGISLLAARLKVRLPGVTGTMSMNFFFVLVAIAELGPSETILLGCLGITAQTLWGAKQRPRLVQLLFNVASLACAAALAYRIYHLPILQAHALEPSLRLVLAAVTFFVCNTVSIAAVIALTESKPIFEVWRSSYLWSLPHYLVGAALATVLSLASRWVDWQTSLLILPVLYVLYRSHDLYVSRLEEEKKYAEERQRHAEELASLHHRTITVLALAIEAKDQTTHEHLERVEVYAMEVGKELGLSATELEALRASAVLHDIGKLAVPEYIISKPGRLTPEEFEKMKIHPVVGAELLEQVQFPYAVAPIVRSHHEKWDGSGYPDGLAGEEIPMGARILSAVDCLDALASDRQYRRALPLDEAIAVVRKEAGRSFDPRVVEVLDRRHVELERMARASIAKNAGMMKPKLSTDAKIERGAAPAAGFAAENESARSPRSLEEAEQRARSLAALAAAVSDSTGAGASLAILSAKMRELIPNDAMVLFEVRSGTLVPVWQDGEEARQFASLEIPLGMGLSGWVAENGKSIVNGNPSVEPGYLNDPTKFSTLRSALAVPISNSAGGIGGVFSLYHRDRDAFTGDHLGMLLTIEPLLARQLPGAQRERAVA